MKLHEPGVELNTSPICRWLSMQTRVYHLQNNVESVLHTNMFETIPMRCNGSAPNVCFVRFTIHCNRDWNRDHPLNTLPLYISNALPILSCVYCLVAVLHRECMSTYRKLHSRYIFNSRLACCSSWHHIEYYIHRLLLTVQVPSVSVHTVPVQSQLRWLWHPAQQSDSCSIRI